LFVYSNQNYLYIYAYNQSAKNMETPTEIPSIVVLKKQMDFSDQDPTIESS